MSIIPDPEELLVCPYDPVHRVAAKKFPYHLNKCRKQFGKCGEYKSCPFNARHVIPAPEYQYHMETCESKAAIEMEIAFEQSRNDTTGVVKGCTDIPKTPEWIKPQETENWDDDDEEPPTIITKPQPLKILPPDNLPRPMASHPPSRKSNDNSPNRWYQGDKRGGRNYSSPRASRGRHILNFNRGDEHLLSSVKSDSPISSEILDQDDFPPLTVDTQPSPSNRKHVSKFDSPLKTEHQHPPTSLPPPRQTHQSYAARAQPKFHSQPQPNLPARTEPNLPSHTESNFLPRFEHNLPSHTQHTDQGYLPPHPTQSQHTYNIPSTTLEQPTSNSLVRLALQNPPVLQPSFTPPTNPVSPPLSHSPYPQQDNSLPPPVSAPQQPFTQPSMPVNPAQTYPYNQPQPAPAQHYAPPAMQPTQTLHTIPPPVPSNIPPQHYLYNQNQPQYQTIPANNQLPYNQPSYPPQPQYTSVPHNQYNAPQYAPQQFYQAVPQYNPVQSYQPHPGQLAPNSYQQHLAPAPQGQYAPSLTGSQVSVQRPPGPGLIAEKNRALHQLPPPALSNDAYLSANSVPIKLTSMYTPPMAQPQGEETSVVTLGSQSPGTGRGRGRGLSPSASPKCSDHVLPTTNPGPQPPSMNSLSSQMQQVHLSTYQNPTRLPSQPNSNRPSISRVMWVKQSLASIELLQIKRNSGHTLTAGEEELILSKNEFLEELKNF